MHRPSTGPGGLAALRVQRAARQLGSTLQSLASANTAFALSFFPAPAAAASGEADRERRLSPYSVSVALTMAASGAAGETAAQMQSVLHLAATGAAEALVLCGACVRRCEGRRVQRQHLPLIANAIWAQKGKAFRADFEGTLENGFDAPLQLQADFMGALRPAAAAINSLGLQRHAGRDPSAARAERQHNRDAPRPRQRDRLSSGTWAERFDAGKTSPQPFTLGDGSTIMVPTMNGLMDVKASQNADLTVLEMPYKGGEVVMDFLMPIGTGGLAAFEAGLTPAFLAGALQQLGALRSGHRLRRPQVHARSTQVELKSVLEGMGMTDAFDLTKADFSKMDGAMDLSIAAVVQQARIEVDENGTATAAAATAVSMCNCFAVTEPNTVRIDHPFVFLLRSTQTGSILFMGQVAQPAM